LGGSVGGWVGEWLCMRRRACAATRVGSGGDWRREPTHPLSPLPCLIVRMRGLLCRVDPGVPPLAARDGPAQDLHALASEGPEWLVGWDVGHKSCEPSSRARVCARACV
jgi:hypothetical protein